MLICVICGIFLSACERRELTYYMESEITLTADWSKANLNYESAYGATVIFYPQDGRAPQVVLMGDRTQTTVRLGKGHYDIVLFNRSFNDFSSVAFRGQDKFETLEAYTRKVDTRSGADLIVSSPEKLATAVIRDFEVTEGMLGNYAPAATRKNAGSATCATGDCTLHFNPVPLTREIQATLTVKGLHNVYEAQCTLSNIYLSVFLADKRPGNILGKQEFTVENPVFNEGSQTEGTLTGTLNVFGIDTEETHEIKFKALLTDKQTVVEQELTGVTIKEGDVSGSDVLNLFIEASAPEVLPDVKPSGSTDSGFDADVDDWGKEENTELPA